MNVYNKSSVIQFYKKHADARMPLEVWYEDVERKSGKIQINLNWIMEAP